MKFIVLCAGLLLPGVALAQTTGYSQPPIAGPFGTASGSNGWAGAHNSVPRKNLAGVINGATACNATTAPFSSFGNYGISVTGASCLISCPSSIVMGDLAVFHIIEGAGANLIKFDATCYGWVGKTALVPTASGNDTVTCEFMSPANADGTSASCTALANVGAPAIPVTVKTQQSTNCTTTVSTTTCAAPALVVTAGDYLVVANGNCSNANCNATAPTTNRVTSIAVTSGTGTITGCALSAGDTNADPMRTSLWLCSISGSGSPVITATYNGGVFWNTITVMDVGGLAASGVEDGVGNTSFNGTGTSVAIQLNGAGTTQPNQFIVNSVYCANDNAPSTPAGYTKVPGASGASSFYSTANSAGVNAVTLNCVNNTGQLWAAVVTALKPGP